MALELTGTGIGDIAVATGASLHVSGHGGLIAALGQASET